MIEFMWFILFLAEGLFPSKCDEKHISMGSGDWCLYSGLNRFTV